MVEQWAQKHYDFAMLFYCNSEKASFKGLSAMRADEKGHYTGNLVGSQEFLHYEISKYVPGQLFDQISENLQRGIEALISAEYEGPLGIDLIWTGEKLHVAEINLRFTMGFMALGLARYVAGKALYEVVPGDLSAQCDPTIINNKLTAGRLALTPPGGDFSFLLTAF